MKNYLNKIRGKRIKKLEIEVSKYWDENCPKGSYRYWNTKGELHFIFDDDTECFLFAANFHEKESVHAVGDLNLACGGELIDIEIGRIKHDKKIDFFRIPIKIITSNGTVHVEDLDYEKGYHAPGIFITNIDSKDPTDWEDIPFNNTYTCED